MVAQHPFDQSRYQVRLEWGVDGLARLAPSDVVIVVDVLPTAETVDSKSVGRRCQRAGSIGPPQSRSWLRTPAPGTSAS